MQVILLTIFGLSILILLYTYLGYPLVLWLLTARKQPAPPSGSGDGQLPSVSMLVAAYNEDKVIAQKIANCLELDYPREKIEFIFVSDGSTDGTNEILTASESEQVRVKLLPGRGGKINALLAGFPMCRSEVLLFSDANTYYRPAAVRKLVRHFQNPEVGAVTGDVRLRASGEKFGTGEGLYYRYERRLQAMESAYWSTITVDGAMYALRRPLLQPPAYKEVPDDFVIGMKIVLQGYRMIYEPDAIADEDPTPSNAQEFGRKVRIVAHGIQSFLAREGVPSLRQCRIAWLYISHKLLRWIAPIFLLGAFLSAVALSVASSTWVWLVWAQLGFYALALAGWRFEWAKGSLFRIPYYFSMVNLAALLGCVRGLRKGERPVGIKTDRVAA